jgi:two-component system LytT family response regulator
MIRVIIVEDNESSVEALLSVIRFFDGEISVIGVASTLALAKPLIESTRPDILLLDIELPDGNSMDMVEKLEYLPWIIFISGHADFIQKAFDYPTVHYLLKPISFKKFKEAIDKYKDFANRSNGNPVITENGTIKPKKIYDKIALTYSGKVNLVEINSIIRLESSSNYTKVLLNDGNSFLVASTLMVFEGQLPREFFIRINRSNIININHIQTYDKSKDTIILKNMQELPIGRNKHHEIEEAINQIAIMFKA